MPVTEKTSFTLTPETTAQIVALARLWSLAGPLPKSHVIAECVRRCYEAETARKGRKDAR